VDKGQPRSTAAEGERASGTRKRKGRLKKTSRKTDVTAEAESLKKQLETMSAEVEEHKEKWLRALADFENYRKRIDRDWTKKVKEANEELLRLLLPVLDSFERGFETAEENPDASSFVDGMKLVYQQLKSILEAADVTVVDPVGEPFDPSKHDALMQLDSKDIPSNHVVQVLEKGYLLGEKVLRPAKVSVAK
jgi:molecular chaperone GrpE